MTGFSVEFRQSTLDLRIIGAILETYREHHLNIPATSSFEPVKRFASSLDPSYSKHFSLVDGWGRDYLFYTVHDDVVVLSRGANGEIDHGEEIIGILNTEFGQASELKRLKGDDLILFNDSFVVRSQPQRTYQLRAMADIRSIGTALDSYFIDFGAYPAAIKWVGSGELLGGVSSASLHSTH